jgi:hypothetical protein
MAEKSLENSRRMGGGGGGGPRKNMGKNAHNTNGHNKPNERRKNTSNRSQQGNLLPKTPFKIETTHFSSIFHSEVCRAAKYKVHAPNCNCSKVDRLRQRYHQEKDRNGNKSLAEQLTDLNISDPFDNLIVVPDTKTTPAIFVCNETTSNEFRNDATLCERKLANAIFDGNNDTTSLDALPFKVSCALCLLSHQKNGFVAIVATNSAQELQPVISKARKAASETANHKLHSDHAHFICAVQISSCRSLLQSAKTRSKHGKIVSEILTQLKHGGVDLPSSTDDASCTIQLGHHLTSLLWLQGKLKSSRRSQYIMVLGYVDGPTELVLDLPGGSLCFVNCPLRVLSF